MKELNEFLNTKAKNNLTRISYETSIVNFLNFVNVKNIEELEKLSASRIREYFQSLEGTVIESSLNAKMRPIKSFYSWLWKQEYIKVNTMLKIEGYKEETLEILIPSDEEYDAILSVCSDKQEELSLRLAYEVGLRVHEMINVKRSNIHNEKVTVKGKGNKTVSLKLNPTIINLINTMEDSEKSDYVLNRFGKKISTVAIWKRYQKIFKTAGFSDKRIEEIGHPHTGRHYFVSTILEITGDIALASKLARHTSIKVTERYAHAKKGKLDNIMDTIFSKRNEIKGVKIS